MLPRLYKVGGIPPIFGTVGLTLVPVVVPEVAFPCPYSCCDTSVFAWRYEGFDCNRGTRCYYHDFSNSYCSSGVRLSRSMHQ
jgi:hypothetical protein